MVSALFLVLLSISHFCYATSQEVPIGADSLFVTNAATNELKVMSWNVLNLFDAEKDLLSDDWLWLPKNYPGKQNYCAKIPDERDRKYCASFDWTPEKIDLKLEQIRKVVSYQGSLPNMIALEEIENENVVKILAKKLGFQNVIATSSADKRGMDVALIFNTSDNLKILGSKSLYVPLPNNRPGRDILRVDFTWFDKPISIYVNHWPAQQHPNEERMICANIIKMDIDQKLAENSEWMGFAVGDFNTLNSDVPNPFDSILYDKSWKNALVDGEQMGRTSVNNPSMAFSPPGSFYYAKEDSWSDFDRLVLTQNLADGSGIEFEAESLRYPFPMFMSHWIKVYNIFSEGSSGKKVRVPFPYNFNTNDEAQRGFSDHVPMIFKLISVKH